MSVTITLSKYNKEDLYKVSLQKKQTKKVDKRQLRSDPPSSFPKKVDKTFFLSFLKLDYIRGNFGKFGFFPPWRSKTLRKISQKMKKGLYG